MVSAERPWHGWCWIDHSQSQPCRTPSTAPDEPSQILRLVFVEHSIGDGDIAQRGIAYYQKSVFHVLGDTDRAVKLSGAALTDSQSNCHREAHCLAIPQFSGMAAVDPPEAGLLGLDRHCP